MFIRPAFFWEDNGLENFKKKIRELSVNNYVNYGLIIQVVNDYS